MFGKPVRRHSTAASRTFNDEWFQFSLTNCLLFVFNAFMLPPIREESIEENLTSARAREITDLLPALRTFCAVARQSPAGRGMGRRRHITSHYPIESLEQTCLVR